MKKRLTLIATFLCMSSLCAQAQDFELGQKLQNKGFYLKAGVGVNKMNGLKEDLDEFGTVKSKSQISPSGAIGFGGYITDIVRADMVFDYSQIKFKNTNKSDSKIVKVIDGADEVDVNLAYKLGLKRKALIYALMTNAYLDLPVTEDVKIFIGAGVGLAMIKEKNNVNGTLSKTVEGVTEAQQISESFNNKKKLNFAYNLSLGSSVQISSALNLELAYSWKDFGKTKYDVDDMLSTNHYKGHSLAMGVRFAI